MFHSSIPLVAVPNPPRKKMKICPHVVLPKRAELKHLILIIIQMESLHAVVKIHKSKQSSSLQLVSMLGHYIEKQEERTENITQRM